MRLATNGVPLLCPATLHFSLLNQFRQQRLGNPPVASLTCFTRGSLSAFYSPLPEPKILCLLLIPIAWMTLGSRLNLMLPFSHLTSVLHCPAVGFPESHCRNGSIKICLQAHSIFQMPIFSPLLGPYHPSLPSVSNTSQHFLLLPDLLSPQCLWWAFLISPHPSRLFSPVFLIHSICFHHSFKCRCSLRFIFWLHAPFNDVVYHITSET